MRAVRYAPRPAVASLTTLRLIASDAEAQSCTMGRSSAAKLNASGLKAPLASSSTGMTRTHRRCQWSPAICLWDRRARTTLFQLIARRYERGSIILTSNQGLTGWGKVFGDPIIATAILDRLLYHSTMLNVKGESYRLKEKRERPGYLAALRHRQPTPQ